MNCDLLFLHQGLGGTFSAFNPQQPVGIGASWERDLRHVGTLAEHTVLSRAGGEIPVLRGGDPGGLPLWIGGRCETTMDVAWKLNDQGVLPEWGAVLAREQCSGRGQLRRPWVSQSGNLYVSFLLSCPPAPWDALLSLVMGHLFSSALEALGGTIRIKWPNDLYQHGRKVGGILVEQRGQRVVVGLGINLCTAPGDDQMRRDAAARAGLLQLVNKSPGPLSLWQALVNQSKNAYKELLENNSPSTFLSLVSQRLLWVGRMIHHREGQRWERARLVGLHRDGGLILEKKGIQAVVYSGSILFEQP
ncbi:MAG: biotin--[acetyl-CoA-carboxylase] ligase [Desulfovibrio sp.]|jgi:BirA family biotin operon repressor/biotin-[acetyl-CoA-carboxylase] ligase|nr:biotin--[acetyl-CoA-carboxylase] ligase [Desulfovibrio sp.]